MARKELRGGEGLRREREERRRHLKREREGSSRANRSDTSKKAIKYCENDQRTSGPRKDVMPEGWIDCPGGGEVVGGLLIPSKVPLGDSFNHCVPPGKRYCWKQVVHQHRLAGRDVGMVIDLTNTSRYYPSSDWTSHAIKHLKIPCKGRNQVPDNLSVHTFVYEAMRFFHHHVAQRGQKNKCILVHCTHGFNRTGFMIVHYLLRTQCSSVAEALQLFAAARPPGIYKPDYIDALFAFYNERKPDSVVCPPVPEWKSTSSDNDDDKNTKDDAEEEEEQELLREMDVVEETSSMSNDDVLGDPIPLAQQLEMQKICCMKLAVANADSMNANNLHFPGSQPVSVDRQHLERLRQRYYYATWKADGTRYMMLIARDGCYLIDRRFQFRRLQLRFPVTTAQPIAIFHHLTLLDGEMVIDTVPETGRQIRRYLAYDIMVLNSKPVINLPFHERWKLIHKELIEPRVADIAKNSHYMYEMEAIRVRRKDFWMLSYVPKLLMEFIPKLSHKSDGLIFQGWDDPYVINTHHGLLKWKYAHMNSVDFLFHLQGDNKRSLYLFHKGRKRHLEDAHLTFPYDDQNPSKYSDKIIECCWNAEENTWEFMRVRPDKPTPNSWNTYLQVMQSIRDNIDQDALLAEVSQIIRLPMYAERMKHDTRRPNPETARRH